MTEFEFQISYSMI